MAALAGASAALPAAAQPVACGEWEFIPSPNLLTTPGDTNILYGAGASAPDDVWAVGIADDGPGPTKTLAMHWDGAAWSITPTPNPDRGRNDLNDVATLGPDDAWAVGSFNGHAFALILRWEGSSWTIFDTGLGAEHSSLDGIDAIAPDDIWAVGRSVDPGGLALHWHDGLWERFNVPPVGELDNRLQDVSAAGSDDVWAVGHATGGSGGFEAIAAHWDGASWESMLVPAPGAQSQLWGVAAAGPDDIWAVGDYFDLAEGKQPLIVHWNGDSWAPFDLPVFPGGPAGLWGVAALAPDEIYAVGTHREATGPQLPLILRYDGAAWTMVDPPQSDGFAEWFRGAAAVPGGGVWAVGQYSNDAATSTLTERLAADCCRPDCNGSGGLDFFDFLCFQNQFAAGDPQADCDGSGALDFFDFLCFQNEFASACP